MNCKDCEYFHIRMDPIKAEGGVYWDLGLAECKKHDVVASFGTMRQIDKLTCVEEAHNMKVIEYEVNVGDGCGTGSVCVEEDATDDDIRLAIMKDLYSVDYWSAEEET